MSLSAETPHVDVPSKGYAIDGTFLTFPGMAELAPCSTLLLPLLLNNSSPHRALIRAVSRALSPVAVSPISTPLAFQYLSRHPDVGSSIETDDCPYRLKPR